MRLLIPAEAPSLPANQLRSLEPGAPALDTGILGTEHAEAQAAQRADAPKGNIRYELEIIFTVRLLQNLLYQLVLGARRFALPVH